MADKLAFANEEMAVDEGLGYPRAYAKLCRSHNVLKPYSQGPPSVFMPYTLQPQKALRAKDLNQMFPVLDPEAIPSANPRGYVNLLWKQLDHLGNAGFDPALFRVDPYGNVLYLHADSASPLAWDVDHWFPCSRGGRTVPSNLRILQWQVCRKKQNKLEFLIPWWDLQLGISVNQFLSIFASKCSDFRNRAFIFLFPDGGSEEMNALQTVEAHRFPQHFIEMKQQLGLAAAAIVPSQRHLDDISVLKPLDINRSLVPCSSLPAAKKSSGADDECTNLEIQRFRASKENDKLSLDGNNSNNPYLSIVVARDSLRQREENKKKQAEISQLEDELNELKQKTETERTALQDLEALLIKKRRRVEKCRRLSEAQSSYRALLEKMIRDAMHQSVVYKEQLRINQAATSTLMARLEAQRALCNSSQQELQKKFKQREEIEKKLRPCRKHARKRSRTDDTLFEESDDEQFLMRMESPLKKELRKFLEEEQKASQAGLSPAEEDSKDTETSDSIEEDDSFRPSHSNMKLPPAGICHWTETNEADKSLSIPGLHCEAGEAYKLAVVNNDVKSNMKSSSIQSSDENNRTAKDEKQHSKLKKSVIHEGSSSSRTSEQENNGFYKGQCKEYDEEYVAKAENSFNDELKRIFVQKDRHYRKNTESDKSIFFQNLLHEDDDAEDRNQVGKKNVEKWLEMLFENAEDSPSIDPPPENTELNEMALQTETTRLKQLERNAGFALKHDEGNAQNRDSMKDTSEMFEMNDCKIFEKQNSTSRAGSGSSIKKIGRWRSPDARGREERCESSKGLISFPSSPSVILNMRKGVDCIGRKPKVTGEDEEVKDYKWGFGNYKFIKTRSSRK